MLRKRAKILSAFLAMLLLFTSMVTPTLASENDYIPESEIQAASVSPEPRINRTSSVWVDAPFSGKIAGDNNLISEYVRVTNKSNNTIFVMLCIQGGLPIEYATLPVSGYYNFYVPYDAGSYYFEVEFWDDSISGWITIEMKTI